MPEPNPTQQQQQAPAGDGVAPPSSPEKPETKPVDKPSPKPSLSRDDVARLLPDDMKDVTQRMDEKGLISLPYDAFIERMNRLQRSQLKKLFGTDNVQEVLKMKTEYESMKKEREEAEKARMSEIERERKATEDARKELQTWQQKYNKLQRQTTAAEAGSMIKGIAAKHINMAYARHVLRDLAEDLTSNYTEKQLSQFTEKHLEQWFKKYIQKNPVYAASPVAPSVPAADPKPAPKPQAKPKVGVTTGPKGARPTPQPSGTNAPTMINGKDVRPGKPNSMTKQEFEQLKKSMGINV